MTDATNVPKSVPKRSQGAPRGITVYRREFAAGPSPTYYCRFRVRTPDGRTKQPQLDTGQADKRAAIKWAIAQKAALESGQKDQVLAARMSQDRPSVPTIGQILAAWEDGQHGQKQKTTLETKAAVLLFAREVTGSRDGAAVSPLALTESATLEWIARRQGQARPNFREALPANNRLRGILRYVRGVLAPAKGLYIYQRAGLAVPDLGWLRAIPFPMEVRRPFRLLDRATLDALDAALDAHQHTDPNAYIAYHLMRHLALRNSEVAACRAGWAEPLGDRLMLRLTERPDEGFTLKRQENARLLEIPDHLTAWFTGRHPAALLLDGTAHERQRAVWVRLNAILRPHLTRRTKGAYELRKQRISEILISTGSIAAAAAFGGDRIDTIEKHYADIAANLDRLQGETRAAPRLIHQAK